MCKIILADEIVDILILNTLSAFYAGFKNVYCTMYIKYCHRVFQFGDIILKVYINIVVNILKLLIYSLNKNVTEKATLLNMRRALLEIFSN